MSRVGRERLGDDFWGCTKVVRVEAESMRKDERSKGEGSQCEMIGKEKKKKLGPGREWGRIRKI